MNEEPTWSAVRQRIVGLWPKYQPTDEEAGLIAQRLSGLRMRWLDAAVESYRCSDPSSVFRLADLLSHYSRIASDGERRKAAEPASTMRSPEWQEERRRDADRCRTELRSSGRDAVAQAVAALRAGGWLSSRQLPARIEEWTDTDALLVAASMRLQMRGE